MCFHRPRVLEKGAAGLAWKPAARDPPHHKEDALRITLNPLPCQSLDAYQTKLIEKTSQLVSTWTPDDELGSVRGAPWVSPLLERSGLAHTELGSRVASLAWKFYHAGLGPADLADALVSGGYVCSLWVERLGRPTIELAGASYDEQLRYAYGYISNFWEGLLKRARTSRVVPRFKSNEVHDQAIRRISTTFKGSSTERAVLYALWGVAHANDTQAVSVSVRQLSECTGFTHDNISRVLNKLCEEGKWVQSLPSVSAHRTARYKLVVQDPVSDEDFAFYSDSVSADPGYLISRYRAFHWGGHVGGLGGSAARVVAALCRNPTTAQEVVRRTRMSPNTVSSALDRLQKERVVSQTHDSQWVLAKDYRKRLVEIADERQLSERIVKLKRRHAFHRLLFSAVKKTYEQIARRVARNLEYRRKQQAWCISRKSKKTRESLVDSEKLKRPLRTGPPEEIVDMSDDTAAELENTAVEEDVPVSQADTKNENNIFSSEETFAAYQYDTQFNNRLVDKAMGDLLGELDL